MDENTLLKTVVGWGGAAFGLLGSLLGSIVYRDLQSRASAKDVTAAVEALQRHTENDEKKFESLTRQLERISDESRDRGYALRDSLQEMLTTQQKFNLEIRDDLSHIKGRLDKR